MPSGLTLDTGRYVFIGHESNAESLMAQLFLARHSTSFPSPENISLHRERLERASQSEQARGRESERGRERECESNAEWLMAQLFLARHSTYGFRV